MRKTHDRTPLILFFFFFFLCRRVKNAHSWKAEGRGRAAASQRTWLFASAGWVSDGRPPPHNPATNVPLRNAVRGTWKDTEMTHLVMGELSNASRCPAQKKSPTPLLLQPVGERYAHCEVWAGITASVFSTNQSHCFGTDSRLVVFHNPWHHTAFKSILKVTNVAPP